MILGGLAFSILKIKTLNGTIVIENLPKDAEVLVDGDTVDISWDNGKANVVVKPGERKVEVKQGNTIIEGETVTVRSSAEVAFKVSVENSLPSEHDLATNKDSISQTSPKNKNEHDLSRLADVGEKAHWWIDEDRQELVQDLSLIHI